VDQPHTLKTATSLSEAFCLGRFVGVAIEKVLINVPIIGNEYSDDKGSIVKFTLVRVVYSNLWQNRICTNIRTGDHNIRMVDSEGFQYSAGMNVYEGTEKAEVKISNKQAIKYNFISAEARLEPSAKTRGWLWFPGLPKGVFPRRFIFDFRVFDPGCDPINLESLEIKFEFEPNQPLLDEVGFKTLELEKNEC